MLQASGEEIKAADKKKNNRKMKKVILASIIVIVVIFIAIGLAAVSGSMQPLENKIAQGVTIHGISVGGATMEEAKALVAEKLDLQYREEKIILKFAESTTKTALIEMVKEINIQNAVQLAYDVGRSGNPLQKYIKLRGAKSGKINLQAEIVIDEAATILMIDAFESEMENPMVQSSYRINDDRLILSNGKSGEVLDKQKTFEKISNVLLLGKGAEVTIDISTAQPDKFDVDKLYSEVCKPPVDAKYEVVGGQGIFTMSRPGYLFNKAEVAKVLKENIDNPESYFIKMELIEPKVKDEAVLGNLFHEEVAGFSSMLASAGPERYNNVKIATMSVNGTILNPGDVFSYNKAIGAVTAARGYKVATVFVNGKKEKDVGGGVCQVSSTIYCAALQGNLEIVKRYNHSLPVGYVPLGQDATVSSGPVDFQFRNTTGYPMKVVASLSGSKLTIRLMGYREDKSISIKMENITMSTLEPKTITNEDASLPAGSTVVDEKGSKGFVIDTYKNVYKNGQHIKREFISRSTYKPIDRVERVSKVKAVDANVVQGTQPTAPAGVVATNEPTATVRPTEPEKTKEGSIAPVVTESSVQPQLPIATAAEHILPTP